ncbi:MAG: NapC/NirT family cytochrome c [Polyangiaceae bacterium]|nr:NapC/NirT family cytochrome c [Polyangiaceae bacterium]
MLEPTQILKLGALVSCALSAVMLVAWLIRRPPLGPGAKLWLFFGLGPLPIAAALMGNIANLEVSKERRFCDSCHVMNPYVRDAEDPHSRSLASLHSKNAWFGGESCYVCHADYGMFGTATTKIGGLRHVWDYYVNDWSSGSRRPELYKPYDDHTCMRCHPQSGDRRPLAHEVHSRMMGEGKVTCASKGCHGPPHPAWPAPEGSGAPGPQAAAPRGGEP